MKLIALFLCVVAIATVGCKGAPSQSNLVGKWKGEVKMPATTKDDPMAKMGEAMLGMFTFDLELKAENKFTLTMVFIPIEGEWSMSGNVVTLTPKTVMGLTPDEFAKEQAKQKNNTTSKTEDMRKPIRLEVQADGKSMKALDDLGGQKSQGDLIFTKQGF
ncbi:MAG: hypothetical protein H7Y17_04125 [Chlorobia bacterium]|nr:hypothetical protein [Fimbriimonadaceae bacterium]